MLAPLASSSLALLGSNPRNEKRQKPQFLTFAFCGERGIARSARELVAGAPRFEPPKQKKAKALIPMLLPSAEKEGLLAPLASSSLGLLGSNPSNEKRQKSQFLTFALCGERGIARSARELVAGAPGFEPTQLKKAKALIPMPLPSAEKEGLPAPLASSSLALLGSNPRN